MFVGNYYFSVKMAFVLAIFLTHVVFDVATVAIRAEDTRTNLNNTVNQNHNSTYIDCFNINIDLAKCIKTHLADSINEIQDNRVDIVDLFDGLVELERQEVGLRRTGKSFHPVERVAATGSGLAAGLNNLTRDYSVKVKVMDGVTLRFSRNLDDSVRLGVDLEKVEEEDEVEDVQEEQEEVLEEKKEEDDDGRAGLSSLTSSGHRKKKKKSSVSKTYKKFLSVLPMFLIPFVIQAVLLPLFLAFLKLVAIKSVFVGKLALLLTGYNALRNASIRRQQDDDNEHIAVEHYGYNGDMEYGALVNSRKL